MKMNKMIFLVAAWGCCTSAVVQARTGKAIISNGLTVHGIVRDAVSRKPVEGAKIAVGKFNAITNEKGEYRIGVPSRMVQLSFSAAGYVNREVALQGDSIKNVSIYADAFRSETAEDAYTNTPVLSVEDILQNRLGSDVRAINRSAATAVGDNMFIRGYNSLNANAQPLIIVDGTIWDEQNVTSSVFNGFYQNPLSDIDVNDIESVQILKDATSIYGSKGGNGAIIVKTKRGRSSVTRIGADISFGFNLAPRKYDVMDASQYRTYLSEIMKGSSSAADLSTTFSKFFGTDKNAADYSTYHNMNDWNDDVYHTGNTQHYGINVQGGDDIAKYAISLGYSDNRGTVKSTDFSRLNARINADVYLHRKLTLETSIYFSHLSRDMQDDGVNAYTSPTYIACIKSPFLVPYRYTDDGSILTNTLNDVDALGVSNPVSLINNAKNTNKHYRFGFSLAPVWTVNDVLKVSGRFTYTLNNTKEHYFSPMSGIAAQKVDDHLWMNTVKDQTMNQNNLFAQLQLDFTKDLSAGSRVEAFAGYRMLYTGFKSTYEDGHNTGNDKVVNMNNSLSYRTVGGTNTDWSSAAVYAQAKYSYMQRYNLWAAVSVDASSRFAKDAEGDFRMFGGTWATFPSAGASWMVSNEKFMKALCAVSHLDLHASYGVTGNDDIDGMNRYSYLTAVNYMGAATGLKIGGLANSSLKWETVDKMNAGIDISFLNDRFGISFDYFHHVTHNLLTVKTPDVSTGQESYLCNGGELQNDGFEVNVDAKAMNLKNFKWNANIGFAHYKNKVNQLPDGDYTTSVLGGEILTSVGSAAGLFYGYKTAGIFSTTAEAKTANLRIQNSDASYSTFAAGDVHFIDVDGNGIINSADRQVIGNPNPDLTGSFSNRFTYKRFTLDVLMTYSLGNDIYNYQRQMLESMTNEYNQSAAVLNRWKTEGQMTEMPRAVYDDPMGNSRFSDRWIEDGSYLKLKEVKLSYELPITSTYIQGITVWAAATNLATFTHYLGSDPEVSMSRSVLYQGIDNGYLANGRSFYMGLKLNL